MQNFHDLAMFRFNFWPKPFLSPPAAHQPFPTGMDSSSFIPNPLGAPALMVLASTADTHDVARAQRYGQDNSDGIAQQYTTTSYSIFRPGEHFPAPIYAPVHPFAHSMSDRSGIRIMHPVNSSAFRPLPENCDLHNSAFSPAKRSKPEDLSTKQSQNVRSSDTEYRMDVLKDSPKDERPSNISAINYDTNSESQSENGENDRGTPDFEGRSLRKQRKKIILDSLTPYCPICGLTLRPGEVETHFQLEIENLDKISTRNVRKSRENTPLGRKTLLSPPSCRGKDSPDVGAASHSRYENYLRVQCNRQARLGDKEQSNIKSGKSPARSRSRKKRLEETTCPVCNKKVNVGIEELNEHVELCLRKQRDELETVNVEAEESKLYEEYTWAGQTRIRASSMLDDGYAASGFQVASCSTQGQDEDGDLNVDDDEIEKYGRPQYSEADIIPCVSDEPHENRERQALRVAVLSSSMTDAAVQSLSHDRLSKTVIEGVHHPKMACLDRVKVEPAEEMETIKTIGGSAGQIITALRHKLKEKDRENIARKCLICMEVYNKPVTSTQCWHVHCEECWFRTMGAKKVCPQCNMITSPSDLRRIYL